MFPFQFTFVEVFFWSIDSLDSFTNKNTFVNHLFDKRNFATILVNRLVRSSRIHRFCTGPFVWIANLRRIGRELAFVRVEWWIAHGEVELLFVKQMLFIAVDDFKQILQESITLYFLDLKNQIRFV